MPSCIITLTLLISLSIAPTAAQELPVASPEAAGLSAPLLDRATDALRAHVERGDIAGVVGAVVRDGKLVYSEALGYRDLESRDPMSPDALFRLYSMTRPVTSLAAMILWEEDAFELDHPISRYLPQFESQRVFLDASAPDLEQTKVRTGDITVEHLFLHTSGLGSRSSGIYRDQAVRLRTITVEEMVDNAARVPLFEDPGTRWRYGISTTILGRLVEVWSGMPLDEFLDNRVFEPLGMSDTVFWADATRRDRLASVYRPSESGELLPHAIEEVPFDRQPTLTEGGVGLLSTVRDYLRFSQMFLNKGELDGVRILRPETVEMMTTNRVPPALLPLGGRPNGRGWSLGFSVVLDPAPFTFPVSRDTFWWDGSAGTRFFIDPHQNMITVIMAQVSPASGGGFREEFTTLVDAAIVDRR
jgi:CubicO group peptidase (beta-lactamase class C family)